MKRWAPVLLATVFALAVATPARPDPIAVPGSIGKEMEKERERAEREERHRRKARDRDEKAKERAERAAKVKKPGELRALVWSRQPGNSPRQGAATRHSTGTSIAMAGEIVIVDLTRDTAHVTGTYWLKNTGSDQETIGVRFPAASGLEGAPPTISNFRAALEGRPLQVVAGQDRQIGPWYGWSMVVNPYETRVLTVEYDCDIRTAVSQATSGDTPAEAQEFTYRLDTGAGWAGPIGIARIIVRLNDESARRIDSLEPGNASRAGDTIVWQFSQFEPTRHHNIRVRFGSEQDEHLAPSERESLGTPENVLKGDTGAR